MKWFVALFQISGRKVVVERALREPGLVSVSLNQIFRVLYLKKCVTYPFWASIPSPAKPELV